jgi:ABC-type lipoprotein release transport system permease subunit
LAFVVGGILNHALYKIASFDMIQISFGNIFVTLILALIISFLAALLPARRAAKLNPIDALSAD